ncbi:MAG TPA: Wzz/FepE/Etk N-terminal domain-containing protein [Verrucomicrobiae bacterium]
MSNKTHNAPQPKMTLEDVYFVLFRHKWKILIFSAIGFVSAAALYFFFPPAYQSDTELYIRYVAEGKPLSSPGNDANTMSPDERGDSIMQTEVAILQSLDVVSAVVQQIGADKILAGYGGGDDTNRAALLIEKHLTIESLPGASMIHITFRDPDPEIVQPILNGIIQSYYSNHIRMHLGGVVFNDFLIQETNRLSNELAETEDALQKAKTKAGVISVDEAKKGYEEQISQIRGELLTAQAELAEHEGILKEVTGVSSSTQTPSSLKTTNAEVPIPSATIDQYKNVCVRLDSLKKMEDGFLLQGYTESNLLVLDVREKIAQNEELKKKLEQNEPRLAQQIVTLAATSEQSEHSLFSAADESAQIAALNAKITTLNSQLSQVQSQAVALDAMAATILELDRKKQSEEANFEYFSRNLEQSRIDAMLGDGKAPNIGINQRPSPPVRERPKFLKKLVPMVAFAGFAGGLALAFFIELFWDRSVKRPADIEMKLRLPLFITIPDITKNGHRHLLKTAAASPRLLKGPDEKAVPEEVAVASWNRSHPLHRFCEGLRNRLVVYFEVNKLAHNPKLVAVTSCGKGAGVSSVAAGLAATLSETGVGNVLLVDMNVEGGSAQQFHKGKLACGVDDVLEAEKRESALVQEHLYVAAEPVDENDKLPRVLPKRFAGLIPRLKASDFDYVIFDMPPVNQVSMTARLAGLMDQVLLVIESEKTNQDVVKRVVSLLGESNAKVSTVLNKVNKYVPARLHQEFLEDL